MYRHFTGYPGGLVEKSLKRVREERPVRLIEDAIFGMLPKTKLGKQMYRKLKVYAGDKHPHAAQKPAALDNLTEGSVVAATIVQYLGTGRRKRSVARVFLRPGKGEIKVNNRSFENYFPTESSRAMVRQPLAATETMEKFDLLILADGGGVTGQAGAARLGISRALVEFNAELRSRLKKLGFLTRDPRAHERKKYGQKGARKRFQFSKR